MIIKVSYFDTFGTDRLCLRQKAPIPATEKTRRQSHLIRVLVFIAESGRPVSVFAWTRNGWSDSETDDNSAAASKGPFDTAIVRRMGSDPKTIRKYIDCGTETPIYGRCSVGWPSKLGRRGPVFSTRARDCLAKSERHQAAHLSKEIPKDKISAALVRIQANATRFVLTKSNDTSPKSCSTTRSSLGFTGKASLRRQVD